MKKYQVGVKIYNSFEVEASSEEEAEEKVRELDVYKTLMDCDFNITHYYFLSCIFTCIYFSIVGCDTPKVLDSSFKLTSCPT